MKTTIAANDIWQPTDYAENSELQYRWAKQLLAKAPLERAQKILDIGSGDGKITSEIARKTAAGQVVGIDLSPSMIHYAKCKFNSALYPNLRFMLQDVRCLNFHEEFDLILSFTCLHWIKDQLSVLKGIRRSLRRSGRVLLTMVSAIDLDFEMALQRTMSDPIWEECFIGYRDPRQFFTKAQYEAFINEAGLKALRIETIEEVEFFPSKRRFTGWIRNWIPQKNQLSTEELHRFLDQLLLHYYEIKRLRDGYAIPFFVQRMEIEACIGNKELSKQPH